MKKVKLSEIATYSNTRISNINLTKENYIGVDNLLPNKAGKVNSETFQASDSSISYESGDILIGNIRPYLKKIWLADQKGGASPDVLVIHINDTHIILPEYLYFVLSSEDFFRKMIQFSRGGKMPRGNKRKIMEYYFNLPSLNDQKYIAEQLNCFLDLINALKAELALREKQFEYYRRILFDDVQGKFSILKDLATIGTGNSDTKDGLESGKYPFFTRSEKSLFKNDYEFDETAIITSGDGNVGKVFHYYSGKYALHQRAYRIVPFTGSINSRYLYFYFLEHFYSYINKQLYNGTVKSIRKSMMENFPVKIPDKEIQSKIVEILETFLSYIESLNDEIELRQKQYEYYRDKLLDFSEETE